MSRFTLCVLTVSLAISAGAADPPAKADKKPGDAKAAPPTKPPAARAFPSAQVVQFPVPTGDSAAGKEYARIVVGANEQLCKASTAEGVNTLVADVAAKTVALARKHPGDEDLLGGLVTVVVMTGANPPAAADRAAAVELIRTDFAKSPAIRKHLRGLAQGYDEAGMDVVRNVFKTHPELLTRAHAAKCIISGLTVRGQVVEFMARGDDSVRNTFEAALGKAAVQRLIDNAPNAGQEIDACRAALKGELKGQLPDLSVGSAAPESECVDLGGKRVKLSDLKGKVVVLDFWATWCGPCRAMIPHARELTKGLDGKPFVFVSVSADAAQETVAKFVEKTPMPWVHWWDEGMQLAEKWEVQGFPTLYVIDHTGLIRFKTTGYDPKDNKLIDTIAELVKAAEASK